MCISPLNSPWQAAIADVIAEVNHVFVNEKITKTVLDVSRKKFSFLSS